MRGSIRGVQLEAELYSPLDILDRIARLRGWMGEGQLFQFNVGVSGDAEITAAGQPRSAGQLDPLLAEVADLALDDEELLQFFETTDHAEKRQLLRAGLDRLKAKAVA